jgi:uncharacterized protein (TIGR00730 family)
MRRICIFCGAHGGHDGRYDAVARDSARAVVEAGYGIVFGGGRVGLMGAIADAGLAAGGEVIGVIPSALEDAEIAHPDVTKLHVVSTMHERKALMEDLSDAFIALPGGYGTMDEFTEMLTWRQLGIHEKPLGLLNQDGYYDSLIALFDRMVAEGFVTPKNRELFVADTEIRSLLRLLMHG